MRGCAAYFHRPGDTAARSAESGSRSEDAGVDCRRLSGRYQNDSPVHMRVVGTEGQQEEEEEAGVYQGPPTPLR